jgi:hypothetical protein
VRKTVSSARWWGQGADGVEDLAGVELGRDGRHGLGRVPPTELATLSAVRFTCLADVTASVTGRGR